MTNALATAAGHFPDSSERPAPGFALARWFAALSDSDAAARRYLLLLRFAVINVIAPALFCAAWLKGWVEMILAGELPSGALRRLQLPERRRGRVGEPAVHSRPAACACDARGAAGSRPR